VLFIRQDQIGRNQLNRPVAFHGRVHFR
jgi:hypothetical protein